MPSPWTSPPAGPDGALWFTEHGANRIGRITTDEPGPETGNLLRNPGFETGVPAGSTVETAPIVGWATTPNFIAVPYGVHPGLPGPGVAAQAGGGSNFAVGGPANAESRAVQDVDVAATGSHHPDRVRPVAGRLRQRAHRR